jgi:hypothetical protein
MTAQLTLYIPKNLSLPSVRGGPTVASRSSSGLFSACSGWTPFFFAGEEVLEGRGAWFVSQQTRGNAAEYGVGLTDRKDIDIAALQPAQKRHVAASRRLRSSAKPTAHFQALDVCSTSLRPLDLQVCSGQVAISLLICEAAGVC